MKLQLPPQTVIPEAGAYLVGGSVRDLICGRAPKDYDIAVANNAKGYAKRLANRVNGRFVAIGKREFPLYRVVHADRIIDVTPLKGDIHSDLKDRDFTINALACDSTNGELIDVTNGLADINHGTVRMVCSRSFRDDPVRLVRAFRMASGFNFQIEPATFDAIKADATLVQRSPGERIWAELALILANPGSCAFIQQMGQCELLDAMFPELTPLKKCHQNKVHRIDGYQHTLLAFEALESLLAQPARYVSGQTTAFIQAMTQQDRVLQKLALLLHDIGKPSQRTTDPGGKVHFYGHAQTGATMARRIFKRLRLPKHHAGRVEWIIKAHPLPLDLFQTQKHDQFSRRALGRFLRQNGSTAPHIILQAMADNMGKKGIKPQSLEVRMAFFESLMQAYLNASKQPKSAALLNGKDVMAFFDLKPSPLVGEVLQSVEEAHLGGIIHNRDEALKWIKDFLRKQ